MVVAALVLTDDNNALGRDHRILELVPSYVRYFERLTRNHPVIMGRMTFESVGHILKSRRNIIVTRSEKYHSSRARTCQTFKEALLACKNEKRVFVMGGPGIYKEAMPYTKFIFRTSIMARFKSDTYFPDIDQEHFDLVSSKCIKADPPNRFDYCVEKWRRMS